MRPAVSDASATGRCRGTTDAMSSARTSPSSEAIHPIQRGPAPTRPRPATPEPGERTFKKAERSILTVLAQFPDGRTVVQLAMLTGYSHQGGGFRNALGALRTAGYIDGRDPIQATEAGILALGSWEPLPTGPALLDHWLRQLKKAEREILTVVLDAYPNPLTREQIAGYTQTRYEASGGGFRNALGRLRTLQLIEGSAEITANHTLAQEINRG